jgi:hypothetical protein
MDDLALAFLGVIALASLVQGGFLVYLGMSGMRLVRRVGELQKAVQDEIRPAIDNVSRVAGDLAEVSELATAQARKMEDLVTDTVARVEEVRLQMASAAARPLDSMRDLGAVLRALRRGFEVYQQLGALAVERRGAARRYAGDEHLFI